MSELAVQTDQVTVTDDQRAVFLDTLRDDNKTGVVAALRKAGVQGSKGQLRAFFHADEDLQEEARLARGWNLNRVEGVAWEVAVNPEHPSWDRANARILKAYHPLFRDSRQLEVTGGVEVQNTDVADAIDRFTAAVSAAAVRSANGDQAAGAALNP